MSDITAPTMLNRAKIIGFWLLKIAFGLLFLGAGGAKLMGVQQMVTEFDVVGLGQWFRYFTGLVEIIGAGLLIFPRTTGYGALLLTVVCAGAFLAQLLAIHQDVFHTIIMGAILAAIAWAHRGQIRLR